MNLSRLIKHSFILGTFFIFGTARALDCSRPAGSLPFPELKAGTSNTAIPVEHTIVLMQENHSFDNYFGKLSQKKYYGNEVDGLSDDMNNADATGAIVKVHHELSLCTANPNHDWNSMHSDWNSGKNDQFVINSGPEAIAYYDQNDLSYYYELANRFAISDRYFSSTMTQTFPNRFFMMTGTAFGHIRNDLPIFTLGYSQKTIFQTLNKYHITWKYYRNGLGYLYLFSRFYFLNRSHVGKVSDFQKDLKAGTLPQVVFIDSDMDGQDEHPSDDIQEGQAFVASIIHDLVVSPYWKSSALFLSYDEGGGFYDHVSPPVACKPDAIEPMLKENSFPGSYDRYGFRVPFVAVSPFSKTHYVSHVTHDHTSVLKFIETKYNLPALTARDANADNLEDVFDFDHPNYEVSLPVPVSPITACKL